MQANVQSLSKKAIESALNKDWGTAVEYNELILEIFPDNKDAKTRLGLAYIKTKNFSKAKKIFKEILKDDPINQVVLKNYELASNKNTGGQSNTEITSSTKAFLKEPGTTKQIEINTTKNILSKLEPGQALELKFSKMKLAFLIKEGKAEIGFIQDQTAKACYKAKKNELFIEANVIKTNEYHVTILLKCRKPIFKSEKQQEKPFMRKGLIKEPETKIPELENERE